MRQLSLLIKPVSGNCNLACDYCFYNDSMLTWKRQTSGYMSHNTMRTLIDRAFEDKELKEINFIFQGGEPSLIGVDFYKEFTSYVDQLREEVKVNYLFQTNGILLDEEFVKLFKKYNFLVGLSIDGKKDVHNVHRGESHDATVHALELLRKNGVEFNILSVVTDETALNVEKSYNYLKTLGTPFIQFIPCINTENTYLSIENYERFLKELFDLWYDDVMNGNIISIRYFEDILKMVLGLRPDSCTMFGHCIVHQVVEYDGNVYPCDFYVEDQWMLGNINDKSFDELIRCDKAKEFVQSSYIESIDCLECHYYNLCKGGCRKNKDNLNKTRYCEAIKGFLKYSIDRFEEIARIVSTNRVKN